MPVRIVADTSSNLSPELAAEHDITVVSLHTLTEDGVTTTAALNPLELVAVYARHLERGGDDGVVAIHLSRDLSSTYNSALTAAELFPDTVRILDRHGVGMSAGFAALAAADRAAQGADLQECIDAAAAAFDRSTTFVFVPRLDILRKSGRISTATGLLGTALAIKPIFAMVDGHLQMIAKTRTSAKAKVRLIELVLEAAGHAGGTVCIQHNDNDAMAEELTTALAAVSTDVTLLPTVAISPELAVHSGPESLAITICRAAEPGATE